MKDYLALIASVTPRFLSEFECAFAAPEEFGIKGVGEWGQVRKISCKCKNSDLDLICSTRFISTGVILKREKELQSPPLFIECKTCQETRLLFDPNKHGWNAEQHLTNEIVGDLKRETVLSDQKEILVTLAYQLGDMYEDLEKKGVLNFEDYFDHFGILYEKSNGELDSVFDTECH